VEDSQVLPIGLLPLPLPPVPGGGSVRPPVSDQRGPEREDQRAPLTGAHEPAGAGTALGVTPPQAPADELVAVVRPGDDEDFSAWDVGAVAAGVPWYAVAAQRARAEDEEESPHSPDYALRETASWEHGSKHTSRHTAGLVDAEPVRAEAGGSDYERRAYWPVRKRGCSGQGQPEQLLAEDEEQQEEEEEKERRAVDLLRQEDDAWSSVPRPNAWGVIE
jgi:hypothetical protein